MESKAIETDSHGLCGVLSWYSRLGRTVNVCKYIRATRRGGRRTQKARKTYPANAGHLASRRFQTRALFFTSNLPPPFYYDPAFYVFSESGRATSGVTSKLLRSQAEVNVLFSCPHRHANCFLLPPTQKKGNRSAAITNYEMQRSYLPATPLFNIFS